MSKAGRDVVIANYASAPWLKFADAEIGVRETPGKGSTKRVDLYLAEVGLSGDETPWCAAFTNWVLARAGIPGTGAANARSFAKWGKECEPKTGAVVVMRRGNQAWQGHVGFLVTANESHVWVLGGNQGDAVNITRFPRADVITFRWPRSAANSTTIKTAGGAIATGGAAVTPTVTKKVEDVVPAAKPVTTTLLDAMAKVPEPVWWFLGATAVVLVMFLIHHTTRRIKERG